MFVRNKKKGSKSIRSNSELLSGTQNFGITIFAYAVVNKANTKQLEKRPEQRKSLVAMKASSKVIYF